MPSRNLKIDLACGEYDRTRALQTGQLSPEGLEVNYLPINKPEEIFWRMTQYYEFDVAEMCVGVHLHLLAQGTSPFVGIPVFPSRAFRHSSVYINVRSGIKHPQDLAGKRVGIPEWQVAAVVWVRGILQDDYGVAMQSIRWFQGGLENPGRRPKVSITPPAGIHLEPIGPEETLGAMLELGQIDALISPSKPKQFVMGSPNIRRLFPNFQEVEAEYFRRTGIFPIMHLVVIRRELCEQHPWAAQTLYKAFYEAKNRCQNALSETGALRYMLPWLASEWESTRELMGEDYWPYGVSSNSKTLETFFRYCQESGVTSRPISIEEAFAPSTLTAYRT